MSRARHAVDLRGHVAKGGRGRATFRACAWGLGLALAPFAAGCQLLVPTPDMPGEGLTSDFAGGRAGNYGVTADYTGQDKPTLSVANDGDASVHVWLDGNELGEVGAESSEDFDLQGGFHEVSVARGKRSDESAVREHFTVEAGYRYALRLMP